MEFAPDQKLTTCSRCGRQSAVEAAFAKEKHFFGLVTRTYCPDCQVKRQTLSFIIQFILLPALGVLLYFLLPGFWLGRFLLVFTFSLLLFIPFILVHELAHAGMAALLGLRVFTVVLGVGRPFYTGRFLGWNWEIRPLPLGGVTILGGPQAPSYRLRLFFTYLAGPLTHAVWAAVCWITWFILAIFGANQWVTTALWALMWGNIILLAANLWPRKTYTAFGTTGTDGWHLFNVFFLKPAELEKRYASYYAMEALEACKRGDFLQAKAWIGKGLGLYPSDRILLNVSGYVYVQMGEYTPARQVFLQVLESRPDLPPELKYILLNNVAFADVMLADLDLLPQADEFSSQAYQHASWEPAIVGTRGAVLVALGRPDEGIPLLKSALSKNPDKKGKALDACLLARGERSRGNLLEAKKYLETARMLDRTCSLIAQVEGELRSAP